MSVIEAPRSWEGEFVFDESEFGRLRQRIQELRVERRDLLQGVTDQVAPREDLIGLVRRKLGQDIMETKRIAASELGSAMRLYEVIYEGLGEGHRLVIARVGDKTRLPRNVDLYEERGFSVEVGDTLEFVKGDVLKDFLWSSSSPHGRGGVAGLNDMENWLREGRTLQFFPQLAPQPSSHRTR